jgi:cysteine dioxygenase
MDVARQESYVKYYSEAQYAKHKPFAEMPVISTLEDLIRELHEVFSSECVNVEYLQQLMTMYKSNPVDWRRYAKFDRRRWDKT